MKLVNLVVSTLYRSLKNVVGEGVDALDRVPTVNISTILKLQSDSVSQIWHESCNALTSQMIGKTWIHWSTL